MVPILMPFNNHSALVLLLKLLSSSLRAITQNFVKAPIYIFLLLLLVVLLLLSKVLFR